MTDLSKHLDLLGSVLMLAIFVKLLIVLEKHFSFAFKEVFKKIVDEFKSISQIPKNKNTPLTAINALGGIFVFLGSMLIIMFAIVSSMKESLKGLLLILNQSAAVDAMNKEVSIVFLVTLALMAIFLYFLICLAFISSHEKHMQP